MRPYISYRTLTAICLVCLWAVVCLQLGAFIPPVAAQETITDATSIPTPTTAPTWTPTVGTPGSATPTTASGTPATPTGRVVDFRVDDRKIDPGECVTFSWIVRGDFLTIEFDQHGDNKEPVLVSEEEYNHEECPSENTKYDLIVNWLDGTETLKTLKVEVSGTGGSDNGDGTGATPGTGGIGSFLPVTPVAIPGTAGGAPAATVQPVAYQTTSDGAVVTPVGELGSVQLLPETGYSPLPAADASQATDSFIPAVALAVGPGVGLGGTVVIGLIMLVKLAYRSKESR